ncbi:MAG: 16S rRNA (cytosine(967)-C(5))-methyltransferase RsmB [Oscillospiraceae bacterium]|jgi:16S rRNA (cytosine967-C5)-methyltransferase|nr:16S rRNA (cytosine(967)-C(5))-methyltransferase RsmB [Oscillospiraceae bacterium]
MAQALTGGKKESSAREAALRALKTVRGGGDYRAVFAEVPDARERAFARTLAEGVIRNMRYIDYVISLSARGGRSPLVADILRIGVFQLQAMDSVPDYAAINESVAFAAKKAPMAKGLVNAVLRKVSQDKFPAVAAENETARLAIQYSHPDYLVRQWIQYFGTEQTERILAADNREAELSCYVNTVRYGFDETLRQVKTDCAAGGEVREYPDEGRFTLSGVGALEKLESFRQGMFYVQDKSAHEAALAGAARLSGKEAPKILDLCASPGGKSFAAAAALGGNAEITAFDLPGKVARLREGISRLGLSCVTAGENDARVYREELAGQFDLVIADVPCSGFGVIRKKPDIRFKTAEELSGLPELQRAILSNAGKYARAGGAVVYSTCTLWREENEDIAAAFLAENPAFRMIQEKTVPTGADRDGFYYAHFLREEA